MGSRTRRPAAALEVSESWFYKHHDRGLTQAQARRGQLDAAVAAVFDGHDGEYGSPRIHAELVDEHGWEHLSVNTVAASMRRQGLRAKLAPRRRRSLTRPDPKAPKFENLLHRDFNPPARTSPGLATSPRSEHGKASSTWPR
jgi:putative transposase